MLTLSELALTMCYGDTAVFNARHVLLPVSEHSPVPRTEILWPGVVNVNLLPEVYRKEDRIKALGDKRLPIISLLLFSSSLLSNFLYISLPVSCSSVSSPLSFILVWASQWLQRLLGESYYTSLTTYINR